MKRPINIRFREIAGIALFWLLPGCVTVSPSSTPIPTLEATPVPTAVTPSRTPTPAPQIFFDDFSYTSQADMILNGWITRTGSGWPGIPGAIFGTSTVTLVDDDAQPGNRLLRIAGTTDGTTTHQSQVCQQRKFFDGTYGARIFFNDAPDTGADGDQVNETFYLISQYAAMDPNYSEVDYEYLPNGGWSNPANTLAVTSWYTAQISPWYADVVSNTIRQSLQGWHILVLQLANQQIVYYLDGRPIATQGPHTYPRVPMSINFNLWFIPDGLVTDPSFREYTESIDWVYHQVGAVLSPDAVMIAVAQLRSANTAFQDTVPPRDPPLFSPCNV